MSTQENPHAGTGPVVLDIGGDIGALIVTMPADMVDLEVEIIPAGTDARSVGLPVDRVGSRDHHHDEGVHDHDHTHHDHIHDDHIHHSGRPGGLPPHVAVIPRPAPNGEVVPSLVYGELAAGDYELYVRPSGPIRLTASVVGGQVTYATWPSDAPDPTLS